MDIVTLLEAAESILPATSRAGTAGPTPAALNEAHADGLTGVEAEAAAALATAWALEEAVAEILGLDLDELRRDIASHYEGA